MNIQSLHARRPLIRLCSLFVSLLFSIVAFGQQAVTVSGTVASADNTPLAGVTVLVKGTQNGTVTNQNGQFTIAASPEDTLVFSYVSFETKEVAVGNNTQLNVQLSSGKKSLNEIVVIGYGNQERKEVTGAVSTVRSDNIKNIPAASFDLRLQGQAPGVQVKQVTGAPGGAPVIRIRGAGSIGAGDNPLYVVDGFPLPAGYNKYNNPLSAINPADIESITVLKDAASTAIYGSRGANGVILITTKKAKEGIKKLTVDAYYGLQFVEDRNRFHMMTAEELANFRIEARKDAAAYEGQPFDPSTIPDDYKNPDALGKGTDWFEALTRIAPIQNYNVTYSNGTAKLSTMVSAGYFRQEGIVLNTDYTRYSVRANVDFKVSDRVKAGIKIAPTFQQRRNTETEGHFNDAILVMGYLSSPLPPVRQSDGSYTPAITSTDLFNNANPVNMLVNTKHKSHTIEIISNAYLDIEPVKDLHLKSTFNVDLNNGSTYFYQPSFVGGFRAPPPQPADGSFNSSYKMNWLNENTLTYDRAFGAHQFSLLLGYTVQKEHYDNNSVNGSEYPNDDLETVAAGTVFGAGTDIQEWTLISYLGRLNYNFKEKYLISAALRSDGSSRFGSDNRWSVFPSVSAGWRISKEHFFPQDGFISDLKLRASYGFAGNNNIGNYTYIPSIASADYVFNDHFVSGGRLGSLANNQLGWELSRQQDVGLDITMWNGRLSLIVDYYMKHTRDMLQSISIPSSSGFTSAITNLGNVENHGWEFAVHSINFSGTFNWQTDFNISFNRNEVLDIGSRPYILSGAANTNITKVGEPMGMFYGYQFLGLFQSQQEIDKYPHQPGTAPGNVKYADVNGDGEITSADMTIIGNPYPKFVWGMTNALSYKNFDLRIIINGSQGAKVMDLYKRFMNNLDGVFNVEEAVKHRWRSPDQPGNGLYASTNGNRVLAREVNSRWVKDASYLCLRNVSLGYTFKANFVSSARVYVSGQNLLWLTPYKGSDPDINFNSDNSLSPNVNYTGYPTPTMVTAGIDFSF